LTETLGLTPSQTVGPYLTLGLLDGSPVTSSIISPDDPRAIVVRGTLVDGHGDPVPDGMIEFWQANEAGRYAHPADTRDDVPLEDDFWGFGRSGTANDGWYEIVTLKPGRVPAPDGRLQAPHIADPVLSELDERERATLVALQENGGLRFDVRLQGEEQTAFFLV
jgi:protocatechuate 3,4-dioxygenase alpha subunit